MRCRTVILAPFFVVSTIRWIFLLTCFLLLSGEASQELQFVDHTSVLHKGVGLHKDGHYREAILKYRIILRLSPNNVDAWHLIGLAMHAQLKVENEFEAAGNTYDSVVKDKVRRNKKITYERFNALKVS